MTRIEKLINDTGDIPDEFAGLAEIHPQDDHGINGEPEDTNVAFNGEVFFPKPTNDEQRRIVDKIQQSNGVLVQGPPGTGKSHTIANLICHLLATGKRMLITAKTPRALRVLGDLVPEELRPLCINLLGSGPEERQSLASSVGGILRKNEEWDEDQASAEITELEEKLQKLREEKARVNRQLRDSRESETHTQSIAGERYRGTAARIAEAVNRDRSTYEWLVDFPPDQTCPIPANGLNNALNLLRQLTPQRQELSLAWPEVLPTSENFAELVNNEASAAENELNLAGGADEGIASMLERQTLPTIRAVHNALSSFRDARQSLMATPHRWMNDAVRDILGGNASLWHNLLGVTKAVIVSVEERVPVADDTRIDFPDTMDIGSLYEDACKLKQYMENGGKLGWGWFRPKLVKERLDVIKTVRVAGHSCTTVEHFSTLADVLNVRIQCEKAWQFWQGRNGTVEGPYTLQLTTLKSLRDALKKALELEQLIATSREAIHQCTGIGMHEPVWADEPRIQRAVASCRLALARRDRRDANEKIQRVELPIAHMAARNNAHPITNRLLNAIREPDLDEFTLCANSIQDLEKQRRCLHKLDEYLSRLRDLLPQFTSTLEQTCNEPYWEERIPHIEDAWHWAQARCWIEDYIQQKDVPALGQRAKQIEDEINAIIASLASLHAWYSCFSRLTPNHRSHMTSWQLAMGLLGQGTGRHAPRHRRDAQRHLKECREAVPAWVMPLHRVWDTVDPAPGMFDVIIVDEASQCGLEALPLFYLGKKILIVGDDQQISPDAVGVSRDAVHTLREQFLSDLKYKSSFDIESSLFNHGKLRYDTGRVTLREHFRCMPEIIRFSNDLCYADTPLIPLRQYGPDRLPPLEHVFVSGGYREGSRDRVINRPEAEAIVDRITEMSSDSRYKDKSMGVVVLQGSAQANLIENQLLERLGADQMEKRRLICGKPYSFQGDERDIMFLSLVAASNEKIRALTTLADRRRFNVAASRAGDMMILFHSVTSEDLSAYCFRRRLLEFFENTTPQQISGIKKDELERRAIQDNRSLLNPPAPFESWFEVDVALELLRKNFNVHAQYETAGRRIDLVVEGGQARLAIECDGDHWHGADRYEDDMQRQRILERCGWEFFRVRESGFYAGKENALAGLWRALEERDIFPNA